MANSPDHPPAPAGQLAARVGELLRTRRMTAEMSQYELARAAGTTQQYVSRTEAGLNAPTTRMLERLFAVLGWQLRPELEPLDADIDAAIAEAEAQSAEDIGLVVDDLFALLRIAGDLPHLVDGALAARLQGVALPVRRSYTLAVAEADLDVLSRWIFSVPNCLRYDERWGSYTNYDIDPARPGPLRWRTPLAELSVRLLPELPEPVVVRSGQRDLRLRPLVDIAIDDLLVTHFLRRRRRRPTDRGQLITANGPVISFRENDNKLEG